MRPHAAILSATFLLLQFAPAFAADPPCLVLRQHHLVYGEMDVYVWSQGVLVVPRKNDYRFLCMAPDWDARLYSERRKLLCTRPYASWIKKGIHTAVNVQTNEDYYNWPKIPTGKEKLAGLNATRFAYPYKYRDGRLVDLKEGNHGSYCLASDVAVPQKAAAFLQALYDLPPEKGIPLRFDKIGKRQTFGFGLKYNKSEERHSILDTVSSKRMSGAPPLVASFKNYKPAEEHQIVVKEGDVSGVFQELMGD